MAKAKCEVKIKWKGWNRGGYAEVMNGGDVQAMLDQKANAVVASANASYSPKPGEFSPKPGGGAGYVSDVMSGSLAKGRSLHTESVHAFRSEKKHNRLQAIFGGD